MFSQCVSSSGRGSHALAQGPSRWNGQAWGVRDTGLRLILSLLRGRSVCLRCACAAAPTLRQQAAQTPRPQVARAPRQPLVRPASRECRRE